MSDDPRSPRGGVAFRPMRSDDVLAAERLSAGESSGLDRTRHLLATDPGGCWVAEDATGLLGVVTSFNRELLWCLATYAVRPDRQGRGLGTALLAAALHHGRGSLRGMLACSGDPRAVRRIRLAGFSLHPQMVLSGTVDRTAIPLVEKVREGSASDIDLMDSVDRRTRGAAHGADHELMLRQWRLVVSDTTTGSGYAYLDQRGAVALLAATNRRTASRLLWTALADGGEHARVDRVTAANEWALDVGLAARLDVHQQGYLALRNLRPPAPYLHHSALL